jgi:cell division protease FtsH
LTTHAIEDEARKVLSAALEDAEELLRSHRADLDKLEQALLEHETVEKDELRALLGERPAQKLLAGERAPIAAASRL